MGVKTNIEGNVLEEGYTEGWDKDANLRIDAADPKQGKRANNSLRRIEAYWEERRLKEQIGDDLAFNDNYDIPAGTKRKGAK
ncbi:MAG: hypothetical protein AABY83_00030 [Pseudomonadota bacterium]